MATYYIIICSRFLFKKVVDNYINVLYNNYRNKKTSHKKRRKEMKANKKYTTRVFGKKHYLLGNDDCGQSYFLQEAVWDCGWYWGGGYVEIFTNNNNPANSKDISSHSHFDSLFLNGNKLAFDMFKEFFAETPFTESEIWKICELMKSFYIARQYSDMLHRGGAHQTSNPAKSVIQNDDEYKRINEKVIPAIMEELYKILGE